jgi:3',5'-cyclic AMP phosphodiesterase CpdA
MDQVTRRTFLKAVPVAVGMPLPGWQGTTTDLPFGADHAYLDAQATGTWWVQPTPRVSRIRQILDLDVPRDQVVAFALYTHDNGVLKLTAQLFPLRPGEAREVRLEVQRQGAWREIARSPIVYPGWSAHFRVTGWNGAETVPYRVRHGDRAEFTGTIRRDPIDRDAVVVANLSCNSARTKGPRAEMVTHLQRLDPDLLFFAGDQTYHHTEHTAGWLEFGLQFRDIIRDRPTICIPDDHDVGHPNIWGESGEHSVHSGGADGGYFYPAAYVNMVQRQQSWHLPDAVDATPVRHGITVYFTRLRVGGVDFAILEDRKFKTGPLGTIPQLGPRPDHINDPRYDPASIDLPNLELLGARQMAFLRTWSEDWTGVTMKVVLSQTAFCGAVHLHGTRDNRLLADLDCNGWPQSQRNATLRAIRRVCATHLCGDQHLAVTIKHGIDAFGDGPYAFTSPALVNTIYARWWHPQDEKPGANPVVGSSLPWTGDYLDGLGNRLTMLAYANPDDLENERRRGDGFGIARFAKEADRVTFECYPRFSQGEQYPGWPITVDGAANDGRTPVAWLPTLVVTGAARPVVQVVAADGEVVYTHRARGPHVALPVFAAGTYTIRVGHDRPDGVTVTGVSAAASEAEAGARAVTLPRA